MELSAARSLTILLLCACSSGLWAQFRGYAVMKATAGTSLPAASALFGYTGAAGVRIWEAAVAAVEPGREGFLLVDQERTRTAVALVNFDPAPLQVVLSLADSGGAELRRLDLSLQAGEKMALFLDELFPEAAGPFLGTLSYSTERPSLGAITLRESRNYRRETIYATLPVFSSPGQGAAVLAQLGSGPGLATEIFLLNPSREWLHGRLDFCGPQGLPEVFRVNGVQASSWAYQLPPGAVVRLQIQESLLTQAGYGILRPEGGQALPRAIALYQFRRGGGTVSEAGIPQTPPLSRAVLFADQKGTRTALALVNPAPETNHLRARLRTLDGTALEEIQLSIEPGRHRAVFIDEIFLQLPTAFQGVLEIQGEHPFHLVSLKLTLNQRGDPILTSLPFHPPGGEESAWRIFPHLASLPGLQTRILLAGEEMVTSAGDLFLVPPGGELLQESGLSAQHYSYQFRGGGRSCEVESLGSSPFCPDVRDQLVEEYPLHGVRFQPERSDLRSTSCSRETDFSFVALNSSDYLGWALLQERLCRGLEEAKTSFQRTPDWLVTSGYRNPGKQARINPGAINSRHVHGDAADIQIFDWNGDGSRLDDWDAMRAAAKAAGACVEPLALSGAGHIHMDWRPVCPPGW